MPPSWLDSIRPALRLPFSGEQGFTYARSAVAGPDWVEPERVIYDHELVLFSEGNFRVSIEGIEYPCPADSFIVVPPGRRHASWNGGGTRGRRHWVHFDWEPGGPEPGAQVMTFTPTAVRPEWLRPAPAYVPVEILHGTIQDPHKAYQLHAELSHWLEPARRRSFRTGRGLLLTLLLELLEAREPAGERQQPGVRLAEEARALLEARVEKGPPIPETRDLLESLGASHEHISRCFRRRYGVSPHQYLTSLRITRAKILLRSGRYRVGEVAEILGFENVSWFSQCFRKQTGMTPRQASIDG